MKVNINTKQYVLIFGLEFYHHNQVSGEEENCIECKCPRISFKLNSSDNYTHAPPQIFGNYAMMKDKTNQRYSYQSEKYNQKYAIWYCDLYNQWFVGLKKEIGLCQGYAYIDSTSDCLVCNGEFGWRLVQKNVMEYGWNLSPVSVTCEKRGTFSYTKIHTINFLAYI